MTKQYDKYKVSKFKWFEQVPANWSEGRICYLFEIGRGRVISELELNPDGIYPVYSSQTKNDGCLGFIDTFDFDANMLTWTTDGANAGTVFIRSGKFNCTNVCGTLNPKTKVDLKYYLYYLQNITPFYKRPDTNGAKIMNNEMARIYCLTPTLQEQSQIVQYLDYKTSIVDELIKQKEKLIELLKEKRQAIINEAVTIGLNSNIKMKDSGIEWLGEIPESWSLTPLKHLGEIKYGLGQPPKTKEGGLPLIRATNVERGKIVTKDLIYVDPDDIPYERDPILRENDIIVVRSGAYTADSAIIPKDFDGAITGYDMVIRAERVNPKLLSYALLSSYLLNNQLFLKRSRAAQPHLNAEELGESFMLVPPKKEQAQIADYLINKTKNIDYLIHNTKIGICKLKEYRQSLISEAVTGKIDVREWQPNTQQLA